MALTRCLLYCDDFVDGLIAEMKLSIVALYIRAKKLGNVDNIAAGGFHQAIHDGYAIALRPYAHDKDFVALGAVQFPHETKDSLAHGIDEGTVAHGADFCVFRR